MLGAGISCHKIAAQTAASAASLNQLPPGWAVHEDDTPVKEACHYRRRVYLRKLRIGRVERRAHSRVFRLTTLSSSCHADIR